MVAATLIHIVTLHACVVQGETFSAFTVEAARCVDARGPGTTAAVLRGALIVVDAGSLVLCEAGGTLAGEASNGVDTEELTVMLLGRTFIQIFASLSIWLEVVPSGAGAEVAALCVFTQEVTRLRRQSALIQINTGG